MPGRLEFERAIRESTLPALARHLCLTIATWADITTGVIPDRYQPSQKVLLRATGMGKPSLLKYMAVAIEAGWIVADAPTQHEARTRHARTRYALAIPAGLGQQVTQPAGDPAPSSEAGSAGDPELGKGVTQPGSAGDPELGKGVTPRVPAHVPQSPACGAGRPGPRPEVTLAAGSGSERKRKTKPGPAQGQMPLLLPVPTPAGARTDSPTASLHHQLAEQMAAHYGVPVTVRHAAAVALAVLDGRATPHNPLAYVMAAVRRDPDRHRPTSLPPAYRAPQRAAGDS